MDDDTQSVDLWATDCSTSCEISILKNYMHEERLDMKDLKYGLIY